MRALDVVSTPGKEFKPTSREIASEKASSSSSEEEESPVECTRDDARAALDASDDGCAADDVTCVDRAIDDVGEVKKVKYRPEMAIGRYFAETTRGKANDETVDARADASKRRRLGVATLKFDDAARESFEVRAIGGLKVKFPSKMKPHPAQLMTMSKIIQALTKGEHAMIESPTGTGKTLALLCGALAWLESVKAEFKASLQEQYAEKAKWDKARKAYDLEVKQAKKVGKAERDVKVETGDGWTASSPYFDRVPSKPAPPKIFICSRTHSQIEQILRELKRTGYAPKYTVLSSRQRMCPVKKSDTECKDLLGAKIAQELKETQCGHFNRHEMVGESMSEYSKHNRAWDMEDFNKVVEEIEGCPFYSLRHMQQGAEVIFCPYNYLFDCNVREKMKIEVQGAAVIIDEGHNIEDVCRSGTSIEVSLAQLTEGTNALAQYLDKDKFHYHQLMAQFMSKVLAFLTRIMQNMGAGQKDVVVRTHEMLGFILDVLGQVSIEDAQEFLNNIHEASSNVARGDASNGPAMQHMNLAADIASILALCLRSPDSYVVIIGNVDINGEECPGICVSCMEPCVGFKAVAAAARCVVLTSGTLSPMSTFEAELGVQFPIKIEAPHVVPNSQVYVELSDALGEITYKQTQGAGAERFAKNLGNFLLSYAKIIPGGMLVFFPKYSLIDSTMREWHLNGMFGKIGDYKHIVCENRGAAGFADTLEDFDRGNRRGKGSLMFAVFRGKVSEGIDFKDDSARAVFCIGIPFPNVFDVKVKVKRDFNDLPASRQKGMLSGSAWYSAQAYRAYNQALGRCIRHPKDYAALFLCDSRFRESGPIMLNNISKWIRNNVSTSTNVNESVRNVDEFFKRTRMNLREKAQQEAAAAGERAVTAAESVVPTQDRVDLGPKTDDVIEVTEIVKERQKENVFNALGCEDNRKLCDAMDKLLEAALRCEDASRINASRINAIARAATSIRALTYKVTSGSQLAQIGPGKVQGVGPSIGAQIDYFLEHDKFERLEHYLRGERMPK